MQIVELEMVPLSLRPVLQRLYDMKTTQSALREGVLFSTKRNNYYYDTGTGKVIVLDDDTSYIFRVLFDPTLSAETFLISLTKVDPNAVKNLLQTIDAERLFQRPPLLSMGKEIAAGVTDTEQKVEQIILEVTEQCNFRCKYCVYSEDFSGNRDFGNRRMPTEIAFKAIDWALENSGAKLAITFYGGEPLLNFKLMKAVIERSQAKRGNKEIVYTITQSLTATGTIQWAAGSLFYLPEGLLVEAVFVSEGEAVQEGDKIAALRREDVEQMLLSARCCQWASLRGLQSFSWW